MPNFIALGCVEVGENFMDGVVVGSFPLQKQHYTNFKLGWAVTTKQIEQIKQSKYSNNLNKINNLNILNKLNNQNKSKHKKQSNKLNNLNHLK